MSLNNNNSDLRQPVDAVYALICELKQAEFDHHAFRVGFNGNLRDPNMHYPLARLVGEVKEKSNIYN
ncbi:hypothetical protein EYW98_03885 [Escherichia coli]|nr:hypothetical protein [Escherichia coli]EGO8379663.1 hypothetical protein [Escherichia coli]EHR8837590.1 hypothetical protein [Escherichia coli]MCH0692441.1 hypothetical protein [Escherichia coli]